MEEFIKIFSILLVLIAIVLCFDFRFNRFAKVNQRLDDVNRKIEDLDRTLHNLNNQMTMQAKLQNVLNGERRQEHKNSCQFIKKKHHF